MRQKVWETLNKHSLSWRLRGGLIRLSRVRGPSSDCGAGNPGIRQAKIQSCSLRALCCRACIHRRNRRTPSLRIYATHIQPHYWLQFLAALKALVVPAEKKLLFQRLYLICRIKKKRIEKYFFFKILKKWTINTHSMIIEIPLKYCKLCIEI